MKTDTKQPSRTEAMPADVEPYDPPKVTELGDLITSTMGLLPWGKIEGTSYFFKPNE